MTAEQLVLPLTGTSRCGYCACLLTLQPAGDWACNHCRPMLARIGTESGWIAFHRLARTDRYRKDCP